MGILRGGYSSKIRYTSIYLQISRCIDLALEYAGPSAGLLTMVRRLIALAFVAGVSCPLAAPAIALERQNVCKHPPKTAVPITRRLDRRGFSNARGAADRGGRPDDRRCGAERRRARLAGRCRW